MGQLLLPQKESSQHLLHRRRIFPTFSLETFLSFGYMRYRYPPIFYIGQIFPSSHLSRPPRASLNSFLLCTLPIPQCLDPQNENETSSTRLHSCKGRREDRVARVSQLQLEKVATHSLRSRTASPYRSIQRSHPYQIQGPRLQMAYSHDPHLENCQDLRVYPLISAH